MSGPDGAPDDPRVVRRAALRRATLRLVIGVVALDAVAMAVYFLAGVQHASGQTRTYFTVTWTVATALVVAFLLKKVRAARYVRR